MEVRLLTRWGSRLQGDVISVSVERAHALEEAGIGKILEVLVEAETEPEPAAEQAEKAEVPANIKKKAKA